jgi:hypothetical protein
VTLRIDLRRWHPLLSVGLGLVVLLALPASSSPPLEAGAASVPFPLPGAVPLAGFGNRGPGTHAEGELAPVEARALVVGQAERRVGIVVLDVLIVWPSLRAAIAERVADLGLESLLVAATHTHSGPGGYVDHWLAEVGIMGWFDPEIESALVASADGALRTALERLAPARLGSRTTLVPGLTRNRRHAAGPSDPRVPVLRVDGVDGEAIATLFALSAHPTTLSADNLALSPEYPGAARSRVEALRGGTALFLAGALGDQAPALPGDVLWTDDTSISLSAQIASSRRLGERLGDLVARTSRTIPLESDPIVASHSTRFDLPPIDVRARCVGFVLGPVLHRSAHRTFAKEAHLEALRLGELRILGSPFELSVEVAGAVRERSTGPLLVAAHTNGWLGYLVSPTDWSQGGYETCLSFHGGELAPLFVEHAVSTLAPLDRASAAGPPAGQGSRPKRVASGTD